MKNEMNMMTGLGNLLNKTTSLALVIVYMLITEPIVLPQEPDNKTTKIRIELDNKYKHKPGNTVSTFIKLDVGLYLQTAFSHSENAEVNRELGDDGTLIYYITEVNNIKKNK